MARRCSLLLASLLLPAAAVAAHAAGIDVSHSLHAAHAVGARRVRAEGRRQERQADRRSRSGTLAFQRPGQVPLDLREALRAADRRRRRARLDLRRGPEPGHGAARRPGARLDAGGAARGQQRHRAAPSSSRTRARRTAWSGWRRRRARRRPASSACAWASARRASRRWNCSTASARPRVLRFTDLRAQSAGSTPALFRFTPAQGRGRDRRMSRVAISSGADHDRPVRSAAARTRRWPRRCGRARSTRWSARRTCSARASRCALAFESGKPHSMILWGPPGRGQDHAGAPDGQRLRRRVHRAVGGALRREGHPRGGGSAPSRRSRERAGAPSCSSTRCTASTRRSRTPSCPSSSGACSPSSARPPRTRRSRSTARCCRAPRSMC